MPEFLAETYAPRLAAAPSAGDVARAAAHAGGPQAPVRFLGAVAVPEEETCFWLYQAPSAAELAPERITPAVPIRPPAPAPGPPGTSRRPPHPDSASTRPNVP